MPEASSESSGQLLPCCVAPGAAGPLDEPGAQRLAPGDGADAALSTVLEATRALLSVRTPADAAAVARELVERLGGALVPAADATGEALPVDVSFGAGEPLLPAAPGPSVARMLLERHIPVFVRDAHRALELFEHTARLAADAAVDSTTGLLTRRILNRYLGHLRPPDIIIMIDLDKFKSINDAHGHQAGDDVLRLFGHTLMSTARLGDRVGRYGGEEFVVILSSSEPDPFLARLQIVWAKNRPYPITFSAGIAPAGHDPRHALQAADRAMYRAKQSGRNQWQWAAEEDYQ